MMLRSFCLALGLLISFAASAHAGVDYRCLNRCVADGTRSAKCLSQCTYKEAPQSSAINALNPHRVLASPVVESAGIPIADEVSPTPSMPPPPEKNFACFIPCVNGHTAYALCEQRCAKTPSH